MTRNARPTAPVATGAYVYALALGVPGLAGLVGVDQRPVDLVRHGDLAAVVSAIETGALDAALGSIDIADGGELDRMARAHDRVVQRVFDQTPVLPLRLGTMFRDRSDLQRWLADREHVLLEELRRVAGHGEWTVRLRRSTARQPADAGSATGAAYLAARGAEQDEARSAAELARLAALSAWEMLSGVARAHVTAPARDFAVRKDFLVRLGDGAAFIEASERARVALAEADVMLELSGPWPPYHFVSTVGVDDG